MRHHIVFSSRWSRRKQAEMIDEWQTMAPEPSKGFIREIAVNCDSATAYNAGRSSLQFGLIRRTPREHNPHLRPQGLTLPFDSYKKMLW